VRVLVRIGVAWQARGFQQVTDQCDAVFLEEVEAERVVAVREADQ
jgi:hypothetical protein